MKIVFFGTGSFAVPALDAVAEHVVLSVSQPDSPSGRGHKLQAAPVKRRAIELGIPVATPERARSPEFLAELESAQADFLLVASYGQILSEAVLNSARRGGINLHGSLLPRYRGAAPIQRAIMSGDRVSGVTLMQMDKGMDTGDMIAVEELPIQPGEIYSDYQNRLAELAAAMAKSWCEAIASGDYPRTPQNNALATVAPKILPEERELTFFGNAEHEWNRYRGLSSTPGAFLSTSAGRIKVIEASWESETGAPGRVLNTKGSLSVACVEGALVLKSIQPEGKKPMPAADWCNGARIKVGSNLVINRE